MSITRFLSTALLIAIVAFSHGVQALVIRHDTPTLDYENYGKQAQFDASCVIMRAEDTDYGIAGATAIDSRWGVAARHTLRSVETRMDDGFDAVYRGRNWKAASFQGFANVRVAQVIHYDDDFTRFANAIDISVVQTVAPSSTARIAPLFGGWDEVGRVGSGVSSANNRQDGSGASRKDESESTSNSGRPWEVRWGGKNDIDQVNTQALESPNNALIKIDLDHPTNTSKSSMGGTTAIDLEYGIMGGDSGSPIYVDKNGLTAQVAGVVSGGSGDVYGTTSVYVRIRAYKTWITDTILANPDFRAVYIATIPDQVIAFGETLSVTETSTGTDQPPLTPSFSLVNPPDGMVIDSATGEITWTPGPSQAGQTYPITVKVTENGVVANSKEKSFLVTVADNGFTNFWSWSSAPPNWSGVTVGGTDPYGLTSASFPYLQGDANNLIHQGINGTIPPWAEVRIGIRLADFHQTWSTGGPVEFGLRDARPTVANAGAAFLHSAIAEVPDHNGSDLEDGLGNTGGMVDHSFSFQTSAGISNPWFVVRKNANGNRIAVDDIQVEYWFIDADQDGLPDRQEENLGTDPDVADSDDDGLDDGVEVAMGADPLDPDSDADGYTDGYEVNTLATNPLDPAAPGGPNPLAIGINFVASGGSSPGTGLPVNAYAGAPGVAQRNWNQTDLLTGAAGATSDIASPLAGTLIDSTGTATDTTLSFTMNNPWSADNEDLTPFGKLMSGYLDTNSSTDAHVTLSDIPYGLYDIYVYFGSNENGRTGAVSDGATTYSFTTASNSSTPGTYLRTDDTGNANPEANYAIFADKTDSSVTISYLRGSGNGGIHAIQIVPRTVPGAYGPWAASHGLDPATNGSPDVDADRDGNSNLLEFALLSSPVNPASRPDLRLNHDGTSFSLTYDKAKAADGLVILVEGSDDLVGWSTAGITESQTSEDEDSRTMKASVSSSPVGYFLRVRVLSP